LENLLVSTGNNPSAFRPDGSGQKIAFAALHHKDFRAYFVATILAMMADNIEHVISYWLLYEKFRSPVLAGFAVLSHWTPFLLFAVYFGALADRFDCRKVIQAAQLMYIGVSAAWRVCSIWIRFRSGMPAFCW
jgi:MFS family permease